VNQKTLVVFLLQVMTLGERVETQTPFVSIVIPLHNEAGNLPQLSKELDDVLCLAQYHNHTEVIFVDDVSTDGTRKILQQLSAQYSFIRVIPLEERGGQTGCYQVAFQEAQGEYIIRMDGDLQDDPEDLKAFFELMSERPDIIMGLRLMRRHRRLLRLATMLYDILMMATFDSPFYTNSSSFVAFKAKFVRGIRFRKNDHRYLPLIAMYRGAQNLKEIVVKNRDRIHGNTKYGTYKKLILGLPEILCFLARLKMGYYDLSRQPMEGDRK
jgi:glycosyltransferase involved in cell wall biosynthesis